MTPWSPPLVARVCWIIWRFIATTTLPPPRGILVAWRLDCPLSRPLQVVPGTCTYTCTYNVYTVLLCLIVCMIDFACFFLPSASLINVYMYMHVYVNFFLLSFSSADLLGLFDGPVTMPTDRQPSQPPLPQLEHTTTVMAPQISSDISLLEPTSTSTVPEVSEPQGSLALSLFETPLTSLKVPTEYSQFPIAAGWESKVKYILVASVTIFSTCTVATLLLIVSN